MQCLSKRAIVNQNNPIFADDGRLASGEHVGRCINIYAMAWSHAIVNIALDLWMLALPASQVWGLKMPLRRKIGVMIMFGLGIL